MKISRLLAAAAISCSLLTNVVLATEVSAAVKPQIQPKRGMAIDKLKQDLSLTDEQVAAIQKIQQETRQKNSEFRQKNDWSGFKLMMEVAPSSKEYDAAVIKASEAAAANARNNVQNVADARKKIFSLLNKDQQAKFLALKPQQVHQNIKNMPKDKKPAAE